jgi:hypothetical protein
MVIKLEIVIDSDGDIEDVVDDSEDDGDEDDVDGDEDDVDGDDGDNNDEDDEDDVDDNTDNNGDVNVDEDAIVVDEDEEDADEYSAVFAEKPALCFTDIENIFSFCFRICAKKNIFILLRNFNLLIYRRCTLHWYNKICLHLNVTNFSTSSKVRSS